MGYALILLRLLGLGLSLVKAIGSLRHQRPFLHPSPSARPIQLSFPPIPPIPSTPILSTKEKSMLEFQIEIEKLFHKNQLFPRIRAEFEDCEFDFKALMIEHQIDLKFGFDLFGIGTWISRVRD